jgi:ATP-dependent exoDNAse (exonuclease V) beta subunit
MLAEARLVSMDFPHRVLPHTLAGPERDPDPEERLLSFTDSAPGTRDAVEYGLWWHELMESLDWPDPAAWQKSFAGRLRASPDPARAEAEWHLFRRSEIAGALSAPSHVVMSEVPFLMASNPGKCIEGVADVVAAPRCGGNWIVVDWKTNRITAEGIPGALASYKPQLAAYAEALAAQSGGNVDAFVYFTATGTHARVVTR